MLTPSATSDVEARIAVKKRLSAADLIGLLRAEVADLGTRLGVAGCAEEARVLAEVVDRLIVRQRALL